MNEVKASPQFSANLKFVPQTGEVFVLGDRDAKLRLSPVNTRVLTVLIQHEGDTVSRQQIFDTVWANQVVSDDALTRAISDLRAQLKPLTSESPLIGTIPKVGYRWIPKVSGVENVLQTTEVEPEGLWVRQFKPMLAALGLLLLLLWALLAGLKWWYQSSAVSVVILPTQGAEHLTMDVAEQLKKASQIHNELQYLSQFALQSHQGSPFPYFSHELGVRWFIESRIGLKNNDKQLTLNLVDAKTALVTYSRQYIISSPTQVTEHCQTFIDFVVGL